MLAYHRFFQSILPLLLALTSQALLTACMQTANQPSQAQPDSNATPQSATAHSSMDSAAKIAQLDVYIESYMQVDKKLKLQQHELTELEEKTPPEEINHLIDSAKDCKANLQRQAADEIKHLEQQTSLGNLTNSQFQQELAGVQINLEDRQANCGGKLEYVSEINPAYEQHQAKVANSQQMVQELAHYQQQARMALEQAVNSLTPAEQQQASAQLSFIQQLLRDQQRY